MIMPRELFMLSDVPGDVAIVVIGGVAVGFSACGVALKTLWEDLKRERAQTQANREREQDSAHATADAIKEWNRSFEGKPNARTATRRRAP
jgi:hypothetical protein